jgi:hypothetical protein
MGEAPTKPGRGGNAPRPAFGDDLPTLPHEPSEPAVGSHPIPIADRYLLGAELGRGGMGRVVEAYDLQLGRTVAFKEVLPTASAAIARRFAREVQLTARLEHPSIVPLYDSGATDDGRPFYVMRRVSGRPLDQLLTSAAELGERLTLLPAVLAAIDAVAHAHRRGVIHRDLKPANIVVGELGETVVIDWGLAKVIGEDDDEPGTAIVASDSLRTQIGAVFGTPGFMAPEQARGEPLDSRSDVYALGATLYQLLSGAPPHAGTSATEVIAHTRTREVAPVASVAPGAPPELVAIVGKALAFQPDGRYLDARALGEDVRRFLDGRLVAAHQYTPRQRLARFVRRHRGALSVAVLAIAAVTVLAWVGIHRIVDERDAANRARLAAADDKAAAERARDELARRADQLIVMQARGTLDKNPTHAIAVLKELSPSSQRLGDARAVAQAAAVRGAAWTLPTTDAPTVNIDLSADGSALAQASRDGTVRVWDLDRRRLVVERRYPPDPHAVWVGARLLVTPRAAPPELFDPVTGAVQPIATGPIAYAAASTTGNRVALVDDHGQAQLLDVATQTLVPLWPGHRVSSAVIANDGRWVAVHDGAAVAVLDATGHELTHHAGPITQLFGSQLDELAFSSRDKLVLCKLAPQPVWSELSLASYAPMIPMFHVFVGHVIYSYLSGGKVVTWDGRRLRERISLDGLGSALLAADRDLLVAAGIDGKLHFVNDLVTGELHLPVPLANLRLAARPGSPRIVALGGGRFAVFDLSDSIPEQLHLASGTFVTFVDDDTLLLWGGNRSSAAWFNLKTRVSTAFDYAPLAFPTVFDLDPTDGRVLVRDQLDIMSLVLLRKNTGEQRRIVQGPAVSGRLLPNDTLLYSSGDNRLLAAIATEPPTEVARLDGAVNSIVGRGGARFAAISTAGEVVRGDLATHQLERIRLPLPGESPAATVGVDRLGRVLIAVGNRLLAWDRDLTELARVERRILRFVPSDDGVFLALDDHSLAWAPLSPGAPVRSLLSASNQPPLFSYDGRLALGRTVNGQVVAVEASTQSVWDLPVYYAALDLTTVAPTARRFIQSGFGQLALWTLPQAPVELRPWLDDRTNGTTDDEHALVWPPSGAAP